MFPQISVTIIIVDSILWNSKTQKMTPFEVMTTFEGIVLLLTYFSDQTFQEFCCHLKIETEKKRCSCFYFHSILYMAAEFFKNSDWNDKSMYF